MVLPTSGMLTLKMIRDEFGGDYPINLTNYYRKDILPANENVFHVPTAHGLRTYVDSELGLFNDQFLPDYSNMNKNPWDKMPIHPSGPISTQFGMVNDVDEGWVVENFGTKYSGDNDNPRHTSVQWLFSIDSSDTFQGHIRIKVVTDPDNLRPGVLPRIIANMFLYSADRPSAISAPSVYNTTLTAADGWQDLTFTFTGAQLLAISPTATHARIDILDNYFSFYDPDIGATIAGPANMTTRISRIGVTKLSGNRPMASNLGVDRIYLFDDEDGKIYDRVGNNYILQSGKAKDDIGYPRQIMDKFSLRYHTVGGNFLVGTSPTTMTVPESGPIFVNDFYGTSQDLLPVWNTPSYLGYYYAGDTTTIIPLDYHSGPVYEIFPISEGHIRLHYDAVNDEYYLKADIPNNIGTRVTDSYGSWALKNEYKTVNLQTSFRVENRAPIWNTSATLPTQSAGSISILLSATDPEGIGVRYNLNSGSSLPSGVSMTNQGLISGTVAAGTYSFTITADDNCPDFTGTPRTFSLTVT